MQVENFRYWGRGMWMGWVGLCCCGFVGWGVRV